MRRTPSFLQEVFVSYTKVNVQRVYTARDEKINDLKIEIVIVEIDYTKCSIEREVTEGDRVATLRRIFIN